MEPPLPNETQASEIGVTLGKASHPNKDKKLPQRTNKFQCLLQNKFNNYPVRSPCEHGNSSNTSAAQSSWKARMLCKELEIITRDRWVLNTTQGYCIEFVSEPHQQSRPHPPTYNQEQTSLIMEEISDLLQKGAMSEIPKPQGGFYTQHYSWCPKKTVARG